MTIFNVDEIFEMGLRIERNGEAFYTRAAELASDPASRTLFENLAGMEKSHIRIFETLRDAAKKPEREAGRDYFDPNGDAALYLQALADQNVFLSDVDPAELFRGKTAVTDILDIAIGFEKDSIAFFLGIRDLLPDSSGHASVDRLISEEKKHVVLLLKQKPS